LFNLNDKQFIAETNSETGEVGDGTVFHYFQEGDLIWADYSGGSIKIGNIIGKVLSADVFEIRYQHLNKDGEMKTGYCLTTVSFTKDGKMQLNETWEWTSGGEGKGNSILVEKVTA